MEQTCLNSVSKVLKKLISRIIPSASNLRCVPQAEATHPNLREMQKENSWLIATLGPRSLGPPGAGMTYLPNRGATRLLLFYLLLQNIAM